MAYQPKIVGKENSVWPRVSTWAGGLKAAKQGLWAAIFISTLSLVVSIYSIRVNTIVDEDAVAFIFIQGLVFIPIAIGMHKHSRIAAVLGLGWYCVVQMAEAILGKEIPSVIAFLLILMLVNGARGVFAVHRIPEPADIDPADRVRNNQ